MRKSLEQENDELRERVRDLIDERDALKAQANQARVIHTLVEELKRRTQIAEDHANKLKEYLNVKQAAAYLGVSPGALNTARYKGSRFTPPYSKIGKRIVYERNAIDAWMEQKRKGGFIVEGTTDGDA